MNILKKIMILFFGISSAVYAQNMTVYSDEIPDSNLNFIEDVFSNYYSQTWTVSDGLPGNCITDIMQDDEGFIYFGTYEGLVRFNGYEFFVLNKNKNGSVDFIAARKIFQSSDGSFWIGSNDEGLTCIKEDGTIFSYSIENGLFNNSVRSLCEDRKGNVWVGTSSGICYVNREMEICTPDFSRLMEAGIFSGNNFLVSSLMCDSSGTVWVITNNENFTYCIREKNGKFVLEIFEGISNLPSEHISSVMEAPDGSMWFGIAPHSAVHVEKGRNGITQTVYDIGIGEQKGTVVSCIMNDSKDNVWFSLDSGIVVLSGGKLLGFNQKNGLCDEEISKTFEDKEGNIWITTDKGGIQKLSPTKFKTIKMNSTVNAIAQDQKRGVMWVGTDNGLFCLKDGKYVENSVTEFCRNIRIRHVSMSSSGKLLVGTYEKLGQVMVDPDDKIYNWTKKTGLAGDKTRVAIEGRDGSLYSGTTTGLSVIKPDGSIKNITMADGIESDFIMCLYEDREGRIWCGTDGGGIFILQDGNIVSSYSSRNGLVGNVIFKISEHSGKIWICTGSGLSVYSNGTFSNFNASNGLGSDSVFQVIFDESNAWFTCNKGIFSVKKSELEGLADGYLSSVTSKFYSKTDGINSSGVTSTSLSVRDSSGDIWFTLIDGIALYGINKDSLLESVPESHIEGIFVDNNEIVFGVGLDFNDKTIRLSPGDKRLNIKYSGLSYTSSEKVRFKTRLIGFEKEYSEWTDERTVSYTNLGPGTYTFTVVSKNGDDIVGTPSEILTVIKEPAFYQRQGFLLLIVLFSLAVIFFIIKIKTSAYRKNQAKLEKIVQERTKELTDLQHSLELQVEERTAELRKEKENVQRLSVESMKALVASIEAKDKYTNGHSIRVAEYSRMLASRLGKNQEEQDEIYYSALLHDIGKIAVPDYIINKQGKLTQEEFEIIKEHPIRGCEILKTVSFMQNAGIVARYHHERYDGKGYPDGLAGDEIPECARIVCVADSYDAMTSNRSYRKYLSQEVVKSELEKGRGTQFDPEVADIMLEIIREDAGYNLHEISYNE